MKSALVSDIIGVVEKAAPPELAEDWDNTGLAVGHLDRPAKKIWVALDPLLQVVEAACAQDIDVLITHHPLLFAPLLRVDMSTPTGKIIDMAVQNRLTIYSAHTNLDKARGGVNDCLASRLELSCVTGLGNPGQDEPCLGRVGDLIRETDIKGVADFVKQRLGLGWVRAVGPKALKVKRVAVCSGSGSSLLSEFFISGAQVFLTGDIGYHHARSIEEAGLGCVDIGHFASEHPIVEVLARTIKKQMNALGFAVDVQPVQLETDPFIMY